MSGIEVRDLCVRFDNHAPVLDGCSIRVQSGEIVALLGGSGSGKSTLLRSIAGLQPFTSGSVEFLALSSASAGTAPDSNSAAVLDSPAYLSAPHSSTTQHATSHATAIAPNPFATPLPSTHAGQTVRDQQTPRRRWGDLAYVFQDATLLPWRTAQQNVRLPLELSRAPLVERRGNWLDTKVSDALAAVGLPMASWGRYPRQLSGGMRMRVSLARAIVTDPDILLLDEPFGALDEILRNRMNELLIELWMRKPRTILFVTHNIAEAINLSGRLAILGSGRIRRWIENPLPMPRTDQVRSTAEFARLYAEVSRALAEETVTSEP